MMHTTLYKVASQFGHYCNINIQISREVKKRLYFCEAKAGQNIIFWVNFVCLQKNRCLVSLNLAWNGFHEGGCRAMAKALTANTTLIDLDLTCNRIDVDCLAFLLKGLQNNGTLQVLRVRYNSPNGLATSAVDNTS